MRKQPTFLIYLLSISLLFAQSEVWTYCHNGSRGYYDEGLAIVQGADSNLYIAGYNDNDPTYSDFSVISLTPSGSERWVFDCDGGIETYAERANSILYGSDGNIYAAGCIMTATNLDFTVISLYPTGSERGRYVYNSSPANVHDIANALVMDQNGNLYAAGQCNYYNDYHSDFIVISISSTTGAERWKYLWQGSAYFYDEANDLVIGQDGNIYIAGAVWEIYENEEDFAVVSLTPDGSERWKYLHSGPGNGSDYARSITCDLRGNIYVAGAEWAGFEQRGNAIVICLDSAGNERWIYTYNGPNNNEDNFLSIIVGGDGNLYAVGYCDGDWTWGNPNFLVVKLDTMGNERWVYRYNGPLNLYDFANAIVYGTDGNLYIAGTSCGNSGDRDFTVISLDTAGNERWVYRNGGSQNATSVARDLIFGSDNLLYITGEIHNGAGHQGDFTVICLNPETGIEESKNPKSEIQNPKLSVAPNPFSSSTKVKGHEKDVFCVYDLTGRLIAKESGARIGQNLPAGIYFLKAGGLETAPITIVKIE